MSSSIARRLAALVMAVGFVALVPAAALATITGPCTAEGHSSSGGVDLTTATEWHMKSTDVAGGSGTSTATMHDAQVAAYGLGIGLPIAGGHSESGGTSGSVDGVSVSTYAILGARFVVAGSASGDGSCSGQITIILDDVNPLFTILGGGGLLVLLIAIIIVFFGARSGGGCLMQLLDALFGGLGGVGLSLSLEQFGVLDPTVPIGLGIVVVFAILAFLVTGRLGPQAVGT